MLVEDDPNDAELIMRAFRRGKLSTNVVHLRDGEEAVRYVAGEHVRQHEKWSPPPKVILLDLKLPKLNGIEVLRRLKANERTKNVPVVILTSSQEDSDIEKAYALGVNSYVTKPIEFDAFSQAMMNLGSYWLRLNKTQRTSEGGA